MSRLILISKVKLLIKKRSLMRIRLLGNIWLWVKVKSTKLVSIWIISLRSIWNLWLLWLLRKLELSKRKRCIWLLELIWGLSLVEINLIVIGSCLSLRNWSWSSLRLRLIKEVESWTCWCGVLWGINCFICIYISFSIYRWNINRSLSWFKQFSSLLVKWFGSLLLCCFLFIIWLINSLLGFRFLWLFLLLFLLLGSLFVSTLSSQILFVLVQIVGTTWSSIWVIVIRTWRACSIRTRSKTWSRFSFTFTVVTLVFTSSRTEPFRVWSFICRPWASTLSHSLFDSFSFGSFLF